MQEEVEKEEDLEVANLYPLPHVEVVKRLRGLFEPVQMYGEDEKAANKRLRSLVLNDDGASFRMARTTNEYQEAMKTVDKQYLKLVQVRQVSSPSSSMSSSGWRTRRAGQGET